MNFSQKLFNGYTDPSIFTHYCDLLFSWLTDYCGLMAVLGVINSIIAQIQP
jgi:hypothetical protein